MRKFIPRSRLAWLLGGAVLLAPLLTAASVTYYVHQATIVLIFCIAAIGLNLLAGYAGQLSLGHAGFMAIGAYSHTLITRSLEGSPVFAELGGHIVVGLVVAVFGGALMGALLGAAALRVKGPYFSMMTIAFAWIVHKTSLEWVSVTNGENGLYVPAAQLGPLDLGYAMYYLIVMLVFLIVLLFQYRIVGSQFGLKMRALRHSELALQATGVSASRTKREVFVLSAVLASLSGALLAHALGSINPNSFEIFDSIFVLLAVLFGGAGTQLGPVVGAAILTILPDYLQWLGEYRLIVYGILILLTLYYLPHGVIGRLFANDAVRTDVKAYIHLASGTVDPLDRLTVDEPTALEIDSLSHSFGGLEALRDVSIRVDPGTVHGLIGPNGAGKTTLINIATGVYPPDAGNIIWDGTSRSRWSLDKAVQSGLARTFQSPKLFEDMTTIENVVIGFSGTASLGILGAAFAKQRSTLAWYQQWADADALLQLVGLQSLASMPASQLTQGHRRLVELARALAARPRLLLLDEPASGMTETELREFESLIQRLKKAGLTIFIVEHNVDLVMRLCERITVLDQGRVIADDDPRSVRANDRVINAYLGAPSNDA